MITMMMIMIKQRLWKEIQVYEQPEVRCSSAYLHHLYKTMFFILLSKPSGTIFIRNPNVLMVYCRSRLLRLLFIIGNHWMQSLLWGGGGRGGEGGIVQRLKMDIRHDEETDVFQGAWWQAISTPGSTSAIDCKFDTILSEQHLLAREIIFGITKRSVIPVKIRCRKAWEAAVNLIIIDGDRGMEGKGKP